VQWDGDREVGKKRVVRERSSVKGYSARSLLDIDRCGIEGI